MPAYIEARPTEEDRNGGANITEEPNLFVDVFIGPAILEPFQALLDCMIEAHADEVAHRHYGDGGKGCSYCKAIRAARKTIKAIDGERL